MTREATVVRAVRRLLDTTPGVVHWNHSPSGESGLPDRFALYHGTLLCLEMKRPRGGRVAPKQRYWLDRLAAAGGVCLVVTDAEQVRAELRRIDEEEDHAE